MSCGRFVKSERRWTASAPATKFLLAQPGSVPLGKVSQHLCRTLCSTEAALQSRSRPGEGFPPEHAETLRKRDPVEFPRLSQRLTVGHRECQGGTCTPGKPAQ